MQSLREGIAPGFKIMCLVQPSAHNFPLRTTFSCTEVKWEKIKEGKPKLTALQCQDRKELAAGNYAGKVRPREGMRGGKKQFYKELKKKLF